MTDAPPTPGAKSSRASLAQRAIGPVVSVACLSATAWWLLHQPKPELPSGTRAWTLVILAAATTGVTTALRGLRWSRILSAAGARRLGVEPYLLTAVGYMGNTVLPARGGDILRVTLLSRRRAVDWKTATGTLIPERLLDLATVGTFLLALTVLTAGTEELGPWPGIAAGIAIVGGIAALGAYEYLRRQGKMEGLANRIRPFTRPTRVLIKREVGPAVVAASFGVWLVEVLVLWLVVDATYEPIAFTSAALVVVLVSLASAIPAAPGFIGTFDAAVLFGLHSAGVPAHIALAAAVIYRLVVFGPVTLAGLALLAARYGGIRSASRRPSGEDVMHSALWEGDAGDERPPRLPSASSSSR